MTQPVTLGAIALDCLDPGALAGFYAKLLDIEPGFTSEQFAAIKVQTIWLTMHRVDGYEPDPPEGCSLASSNDVTMDGRGLMYLIDRQRGVDIIETSVL